VQSRKAAVLGDPREAMTTSGSTPPFTDQDVTYTVTEPADVLKASLTVTVPTGADTIKNYDLYLLDESGNVVAEAREWAVTNTLTWTGPDGQGVPPGTYTLRASNSVALAMAYELEAAVSTWSATARRASSSSGPCPAARRRHRQPGRRERRARPARRRRRRLQRRPHRR
jgi:hypothetical protein